MEADPGFFSRFSLVIASQLHEAALRKMAGLCWNNAVPFLHVRSYGLLGHVRVVRHAKQMKQARHTHEANMRKKRARRWWSLALLCVGCG